MGWGAKILFLKIGKFIFGEKILIDTIKLKDLQEN